MSIAIELHVKKIQMRYNVRFVGAKDILTVNDEI